MEWEQLPALALVLVMIGLIVGVGVLILDLFGNAAKDSTTIAFGDENVSTLTGEGTLANDDVTALLFFGNNTVNYTVGTEVNLTSGIGTILASYPEVVNQSWFVSYTYDKDVITTTTMDSASAAVGEIATSWMALIVTIAILAVILFMVVRGFGKNR